jgi:hydrogenase nickel incorporation protein HypB
MDFVPRAATDLLIKTMEPENTGEGMLTCGACKCQHTMMADAGEQGHDHDAGHAPDGRDGDGRRSAHVHHAAGLSSAVNRVTPGLEAKVLARNAALAADNRAWFGKREILALNLVSSPGSGKTTLLVRTIRDLQWTRPIYVIEGDQETSRDADRIRQTGAPAVQLSTGTGCHLEAGMVARGIGELRPMVGGLVLIENVGNLVCPAMFDLGERAKVAILSVTEGADKPLRYPHMFRAADLLLLNKIDLLPHVEFDITAAIGNAKQVNPAINVLCVSARTGEGMSAWYAWIDEQANHPHAPGFV